MSATLGSILVGMKYKQKAERDAEELLEQEDYDNLEYVKDEAQDLVSKYNSIYEKAESYIDEPYHTSFAFSMVTDPKGFWKKLGYCSALSKDK